VQKNPPLRTVSYRPFSKEYSGLFKVFSRLEPNAESILAFANSYGLLGYPVSRNFWGDEVVSAPPPAGPFNASQLQPLELPNAPGGAVGELLTFDPPSPQPGYEPWSWVGQIRAVGDFVRACEHFRKEPALAPVIQSVAFIYLGKTVGPALSWSRTSGSFHLRLEPYSLIGALWLQAVRAIAERKSFRECPVCRTPIEISRSGGARADAVFCSDKCKTRDYRERVTKACKLARAGKLTLTAIASRLRTDPKTVRKWIEHQGIGRKGTK
jgi:hypothetical protein